MKKMRPCVHPSGPTGESKCCKLRDSPLHRCEAQIGVRPLPLLARAGAFLLKKLSRSIQLLTKPTKQTQSF